MSKHFHTFLTVHQPHLHPLPTQLSNHILFQTDSKLFDIPPSMYENLSITPYDVAPDGNFLMLQKVEATPDAPSSTNPRAQIVMNWFEEFLDKK